MDSRPQEMTAASQLFYSIQDTRPRNGDPTVKMGLSTSNGLNLGNAPQACLLVDNISHLAE